MPRYRLTCRTVTTTLVDVDIVRLGELPLVRDTLPSVEQLAQIGHVAGTWTTAFVDTAERISP